MNRIKNGLILLGLGISYLLIFQFSILPPCFFKKWTGYACPTCGLTRSFQAIFKGNIIQSFAYHILGLPLFLLIVTIIVGLFYGMVTNKDWFLKRLFIILNKYYLIIIVLLLISWGINLYRGI